MKCTRTISYVQRREFFTAVRNQNFPVDLQYYSKYSRETAILKNLHHREKFQGQSLNFSISFQKSDICLHLLL